VYPKLLLIVFYADYWDSYLSTYPVILTVLTEPQAVHSQFLCLSGNCLTDEVHYQRNYRNGN